MYETKKRPLTDILIVEDDDIIAALIERFLIQRKIMS